MSIYTIFLLCAICGYLLGSVPFGLVLTRLAGLGDIRKIGSHSIGATNVLRTGRKDLALLTVILDATKAGIAAYIAYKIVPNVDYVFLSFYTTLNTIASLIAGTCGILGHIFPIWLKFKGGKGVASAFGFIVITNWQIGLIALAIWLMMAIIFKYSSLAAITAAIAVPFIAFFMVEPVYAIFYTPVVILILFCHRSNINRLIHGQESKISFKKKI